MTLFGPIINIDDDDHEIVIAVCENLGIRKYLECFRDGEEALEYLHVSHEYPSIILCDVNMPKITGFELRKTINATTHFGPAVCHLSLIQLQLVPPRSGSLSNDRSGIFFERNNLPGSRKTLESHT
jgi:Response regulator containing CheY-like receiver domain and AraC-type DNA-binding domain